MKPDPKLTRESRYLSAPIEVRAAADEDSPEKVFGYAAKFDTPSQDLGGFIETIERGAFDDVMGDDVRALWNHEASSILARSKNGEGSLRLGVDEVGLWYEFEAPDTQIGRDLVTSLKRGDVDQSSFSFTIAEDGEEWEEREDGPFLRTIKKVSRLFDVSPVTYPAYPDATVALRSLEAIKEEKKPPTEPEAPTPEQISEVQDWAARFGPNPAQPKQQQNDHVATTENAQ